MSTAWLEEELGAPNFRVIECTVDHDLHPDGGLEYRSGREGWAEAHIPGSAQIYDGSMFEWTADPSLPLVLGD